MPKHPALQMSKQRQQVWLNEAKPEDFFEMLTMLSRLYAKRMYTPKEGYKAASLIEAYPDYVKAQAINQNYVNNVPFASPDDAPGSITIEEAEKSVADKALDDLMDMI